MSMKLTRPITRFDNWKQMGAVLRGADTRTTEELTESINLWAYTHPEIREFLPQLKEMKPQHLGLVADTIELAMVPRQLPKKVDLLYPLPNGRSTLGTLLHSYSRASKENPEGLEFSKEVLNHTDITAAKVYLSQLVGGILEAPLNKQFEAAKPLVRHFAVEALMPPKPDSYEGEAKFMNLIQNVINPEADPEKIGLIAKAFEKVKGIGFIDMIGLLQSKTPVAKMADNMESLEQVAKMSNAKTGRLFDTEAFLSKNTNLY